MSSLHSEASEVQHSDTENPVEEDSSSGWTYLLEQLLELGENIRRSAIHAQDSGLVGAYISLANALMAIHDRCLEEEANSGS